MRPGHRQHQNRRSQPEVFQCKEGLILVKTRNEVANQAYTYLRPYTVQQNQNSR